MVEGFIVQAGPRGGHRGPGPGPGVEIWGRLVDGTVFRVEDGRARPGLFVARRAEARLRQGWGLRIEASALRSLAGDPLLRVEVETPAALADLRRHLEEAGEPTLEADVPLASRFLMERGLRGGVAIRGDSREERRRGAPAIRVFRDPVLAPSEIRPVLRSLSLDLETTPDASAILSVALVGEGVEEVWLRGEGRVPGARMVPDERALLEALLARVAELDPDLLLGWNVVDFDLRVLEARCRALGLAPALGRAGRALRLREAGAFGRSALASLPGRMALDGIVLVRDAMRLEDYRLETVARAVLGRGKRMDEEVADRAAEIQRLFREDPAALVAYNLEDARLVPEILAREGLLDLCLERARLTGMPLDRVGSSVASFDAAYLPALHRAGYAAPSVPRSPERARLSGGFVLDSIPGLYRQVAVYDWKSLYPSLMRTFHLDPLAHARAVDEDDPFVAPGGARFARGEALLPEILSRLMASREAARARGDRHADQAIKILMNSLYGVLGTPGCRFFDPAISNAITGFGQQILAWTRDAFLAAGVQVLYGDTDSVFVHLDPGGEPSEPLLRRRAEALLRDVQERISSRIADEYRCESHLVLQLERLYERFFLPRVRGGGGGSKKRYAGRTTRGLEIVGLEAVRRDTPRAARRLQEGMLERLLDDRPVLPFVREQVAALRSGALDADLVTARRVRKGSLDRYTATTPPHVQAARKAGRIEGGVVRYLVTMAGPEPVLPGRPLPGPVDRRHYLERVFRPLAQAILREIGDDFADATGEPRQLDLLAGAGRQGEG